MTTREAWTCRKDTSYHDSSDDESDHEEQAWVFPEGLEVGSEVRFFTNQRRRWKTKCYGGSEARKQIAIGEVAKVDDNIVSFAWSGAAVAHEGRDWKVTTPEDWKLQKAVARQATPYSIPVPERVWVLLPKPVRSVLVTLTNCSASESDHLSVQLVTVGGGELNFEVAEDAVVLDLAALVAEQLGNKGIVKVLTVNDTELQPDETLRGLLVS